MKIIHGTLPSEKTWRVMVLLSPTDGHTLTSQLGLMLARANRGSVLAAVVISDEHELAEAQSTLAEIGRACNTSDHHDLLILQIESTPRRSLRKFIEAARIDLLLASTDAPLWQYLDKLPCTIATLRGSRDCTASVLKAGILNILMPTSGGPHTVHALQFLMQLPQPIKIEALYVGRTAQGQHEEALGQARLTQMFEIADCGPRVQKKVVLADNPIQGIVSQASQGHDLVVLGASQETSLDKALFGNVVTSVVRESKVPVLVVKRPHRLATDIANALDWRLQRVFPRLTPERRRDVYVQIRENAQPDLDYFVLITLASLIAALGLVLDSSATIIGAMLVAPLMSPIVATGLAMILGDGRFLRFAFGTAVQGVLIAIAAGVVVGLMPGDSLSNAVLSRTAPTLIDLAVAFFSGLAGAFALAYWEASGALPGVAIAASLVPPLASSGIALAEGEWQLGLGALILFITNYLMIALAAALVFLVFGFRPNATAKARRLVRVRTAQIGAISLVLIISILTYSTITLFRTQLREATIVTIAERSVQEIFGPESESVITTATFDDPVVLKLTVQSPHEPTSAELAQLKIALQSALKHEMAIDSPLNLRILHQNVTILDGN